MSATTFCGDMRAVRRPLKAAGKRFAWIDPYHVTPGQVHQVVILSSRINWIYVHRSGMRTLPCTGEGETCHVAHAETPTLIQGWCWVCTPNNTAVRHLTLTGYVYDALPFLSDPEIDLYGQVLTLKRRDSRPFSAILASVGEKRTGPPQRIELPSMEDFLARIFTAPPRPVNRMTDAKMVAMIRQALAAAEGGAA